MITHAVRRAKISGCIAVLTTFGLVSSATAQNAATDRVPTATFLPERSVMSGALVYGSATMLVRTRDDVTGTVHTSGLIPGNVYTAWFGVFNHPESCATRPCTPADLSNPAVQGSLLNFGGRIVGTDGAADFGEVRAVGDTANAFSGPGVLETRRAEIHLAVRNHGPASGVPSVLADQLSKFWGGCPGLLPCAAVTTVQAAPHAP
jgi:hypothetical protein